MSRPFFLWDLVRKVLFGVIGIFAALLFWVLSASFLLINLLISWHHLWRHIGVWNLAMYRFIMRRRNLYDTSLLPTKPAGSDPRMCRWDPRYRTARTADGTFNDLQDPLMGSAGTRFARNFPLKRLSALHKAEDAGAPKKKMELPNPRNISRVLLTRDRFRPASSLNLLAAAWIQFQVHDWVNHRRRPPLPPGQPRPPEDKTYLPPIELDPTDNWPGRSRGENSMLIRSTLPDDTVDRDDEDFKRGHKLESLKEFPVYRNTETHWWDGSQLYGSSQAKQDVLRAYDGRGKLRIENGCLPRDPDRAGIDLTGFNDNWWAGLNLLHTLFALEHNAICDHLNKAYPDWPEDRLFQTARLINTALIAKIHTVEWTPAILGHPTLYLGMRANWWGILTQRLTKVIGRLRVLRDIQEEITGIPGSEQDHHASPFHLTEEFVAVYRMHPLIPDDYRIYNLETDEIRVACKFNDLQGDSTREFVRQTGAQNLFYSFGVSHPGAVTLNNFPRALQHFRRMRDEDHDFGKVGGEPLDLGTIDIMRDRERAVPRYNNFRRMLSMLPCVSYNQLVGVPAIRWFSSLTNRQIEERKVWARLLKQCYPNKEDLDLMVGLHAEELPKGFGFSDTAFRIFVLMAPRRLKSDRFITTDFNPDVYTPQGMDWIEQNGLKTVLLRHYPALGPALDDIKNAFAPWQRTERPSPDPVDPDPVAADPRPEMRRVSIFQMPMFGGAFIGWLVGAVIESGFTLAKFLPSLGTGTAAYGAAIGAIVGGMCLAVLYGISFLATKELDLREQVQTAAGFGAAMGWLLGAMVYLWSNSISLWGAWEVFVTVLGALVTQAALLGVLLGALIGYARERSPSQIGIGACVGGMLGAAWFLWREAASFKGLRDLAAIIPALGTREALIAAFFGTTLGVLFAGRRPLQSVFEGGGIRRYALRAAYGVLFGALIGGVIGLVVGAMEGIIESPKSFFAVASIALASVIIGIIAVALRDAVARFGHAESGRLLYGLVSLLSGVLTAVVLGALLWFWLMLFHSWREIVLPTLDILSFHLAGGAAIGAALGLGFSMFGWVSVAAAGGWVLGALVYLIFYHQLHYLDALFSQEAWNGIALGFVFGFSGTLVLVRDWTWAIVWALRAGMFGLAVGTATVLWREAAPEGGFLGLLWIALTSKPAYWGALILALLVGGVWIVRGPEVTWILRGGFWRFLAWFKFAGNRPVAIPPPRRRWWWKLVAWLKFFAENRAAIAHENGSILEGFWRCLKSRLEHRLRQSKPRWPLLDNIPVVPFNQRYPIPIKSINVSGGIPDDEGATLKQFFSEFQVRLFSVFPPMQPERPLPPISSDHVQAFEQAYGILQRRAFDPPDMPPEYEGSPDLGSLAVRGPYACYTERVPDNEYRPGHREYQWDFRALALPLPEEMYRKEVYRLGVRVFFRRNRHSPAQLEATEIENVSEPSLRSLRQWFDNWDLAKKIALCAATTHLSLVRHFNWVHLASGEPLAIATRNRLPSDHPVCRLLWPHIYGTQQSNYMVTLVQMVKGGDFEEIFSFTRQEMWDLFDQTHRRFHFIVNDPEEDAARRGVRPYLQNLHNAGIETSQKNLEDLFKVIHDHVCRYLDLYYPGPNIQDLCIERWVASLNDKDGIPNGVGLAPNPLTKIFVARLIARFIYLTTVQHEMVGTFLWNYQLWTHRQPIRVYKNGRREPLDVYQRLVNANFNLNVTRRALMDDFSYLALDDQGASAFLQFKQDLEDLQKRMEQEPWEVWKIYPEMLEANINA